jgi:hypothetical protein
MDRMPRPIDSYIAFARHLRSQFDDHAWLAEDTDASTPIGADSVGLARTFHEGALTTS